MRDHKSPKSGKNSNREILFSFTVFKNDDILQFQAQGNILWGVGMSLPFIASLIALLARNPALAEIILKGWDNLIR
jgi:hypothetical protein